MKSKITQKITPFLWFNNQAEEAVKFYTSIFKNSKILTTARYDKESAKASGQKEGTVMTSSFELDGQKFMALNGGPVFKFNEAISFVIECEDQKEIDYYWDKLTSGGGKEVQCGWLQDKFGLSWQVTPSILGTYASDPDPKKVERVMGVIMKSIKINISELKKAYEGK